MKAAPSGANGEPAVRLAARVEAIRRTNPRRAWALLQRGFQASHSSSLAAGRGELWRLRGHLLRSMRRAPEAARAYERAERWFVRAGSPRERGRCAIGLVDALMYAGDYVRAKAAAGRGRRLLTRVGDLAALARLLNNEGNLFHRLDRPDLALERYGRARAELIRAGDRAGASRVEINIANCLSLLGRTAEARRLYKCAERTQSSAGQGVQALHASYNLAYLEFLDGLHERAIASLEQVRAEATSLGVPALSAVSRLDEAEILLHLGGHHEALAEADGAAAECGALGLTYESAKANLFAALAEHRLGRSGAAKRRLEQTLPVFHAEGNRVWTGEALVALATIWWAGGDARASRGLLLAAARHFAAAQDREREGCARALSARALLASNRVAAAEREAKRLRASEGRSMSPRMLHLLLAVEAGVARHRGDFRAARGSLRRAALTSERLAARILDEQWRASFWGEWGWPHQEWAVLEMDRGRLDAALEALERGRGRTLVTGTERTVSARSKTTRDVRLWAVSRQARDRERSTRSGGGAGSSPMTRDGAIPSRLARALRKGLPRPVTAARVRRGLGADTLLVNYLMNRSELDALVVRGTGSLAVRGAASEETLHRLVNGLLFSLRGAALAPREARGPAPSELEEISAFVLWPILSRLGGVLPRRLVIVPTGVLARVPWPALALPDGRALCEAVEVSVVPGLRLALARRRGARSVGPPLVVAADAGELRHVRAEAEAIARMSPGAVVLDGATASADRFLELAPRAAWIHFAGHGAYRPEEPFHAGLRLNDRWIVAEELASLRLQAKWVTLSACQTARALVRPGDEWFGLPRTLLLAGAGGVMASQWDIGDEPAARLTLSFYERLLGGASLTGALAGAQAEECRAGEHPMDWGGFVILGGLEPGPGAPIPSNRSAPFDSTHLGGF